MPCLANVKAAALLSGMVHAPAQPVLKLRETKACLMRVVPKVGLEPTRSFDRGILNPLRLPFRHLGLSAAPTVRVSLRPEAISAA